MRARVLDLELMQRLVDVIDAPDVVVASPVGGDIDVSAGGDRWLELMESTHGQLLERGAFELRRSVEAVAEAMGVSRFTIYNYLNAADA